MGMSWGTGGWVGGDRAERASAGSDRQQTARDACPRPALQDFWLAQRPTQHHSSTPQ